MDSTCGLRSSKLRYLEFSVSSSLPHAAASSSKVSNFESYRSFPTLRPCSRTQSSGARLVLRPLNPVSCPLPIDTKSNSTYLVLHWLAPR